MYRPGGLKVVVLRDQIKEHIRDAILTGQIKPGERISERDLEQALGVSRLPIREAMRQLEEQGLIRTFPHRGSFVVELSRDEARDLTYVRIGVEQAALKLIWLNGTLDILLARLENVVQNIQQCAEDDPEFAKTIVEGDTAFHSTIIKVADSPTLQRFWERIDCLLPWVLPSKIAGVPFVTKERWLQDHNLVLNVLQQKDLDQAIQALSIHVESGTLKGINHLPSREQVELKPARSASTTSK